MSDPTAARGTSDRPRVVAVLPAHALDASPVETGMLVAHLQEGRGGRVVGSIGEAA